MSSTIFLDLDGTIWEHLGTLDKMYGVVPQLLEGTIEKLNEWRAKRYKLVLTTARPECLRADTEKALAANCIWYDKLVMDVGNGVRFLINDAKADIMNTAHAITVERNRGIAHINI